jgi:Trm5-related predicted tRNA methylase
MGNAAEMETSRLHSQVQVSEDTVRLCFSAEALILGWLQGRPGKKAIR